MYERFTDRARKVMQLANQEAQRFNHDYIGTEHILLGLAKEGSGVAANVLKNLGVGLGRIREEVKNNLAPGRDMVLMGKLPQTPRAKKVIEYAVQEARSLGHNYVGTEHLLLGLLCETKGAAHDVLLTLGLKHYHVRAGVLELLGQPKPNPSTPNQGVEVREVCAGLLMPPWQPAARPTRFERGCRHAGSLVRRRQGLAIFTGGLLATLLGAWVGLDLLGWQDPNPGALLAGLCYLAVVAGCSISTSRCRGSSCKNR